LVLAGEAAEPRDLKLLLEEARWELKFKRRWEEV